MDVGNVAERTEFCEDALLGAGIRIVFSFLITGFFLAVGTRMRGDLTWSTDLSMVVQSERAFFRVTRGRGLDNLRVGGCGGGGGGGGTRDRCAAASAAAAAAAAVAAMETWEAREDECDEACETGTGVCEGNGIEATVAAVGAGD